MMNRWMAVTRSESWWDFKIPLFLAAGYATMAGHPAAYPDLSDILYLFVLVAGLAVCAIYVSIVNDYTDMAEDLAAGKANRLASHLPAARVLLLAASVALGIAFCWLAGLNAGTLAWYAASWLAFTLYSVPPFRLKGRGVYGILADASGSVAFPLAYMHAGMSDRLGMEADPAFIVPALAWGLLYGVRGILWHQYDDLSNDKKVSLSTFAARIQPDTMSRIGLFLLVLELSAFLAFQPDTVRMPLMLAMACYGMYLWLMVRYQGMSILVITPVGSDKWIFAMTSFNQTVWPVCLIVLSSAQIPYWPLVLLGQLLLFHRDAIYLMVHLKSLFLRFTIYRPRKHIPPGGGAVGGV